MAEEVKDQVNDSSKDAKKYADTIKKLQAILGTEKLELPTRVNSNQVEKLVSELFKEEAEANFDKFKADLKEMLKKHVEMTRDIKKKKQELETLEKTKQKEFVAACKGLFDNIEGLDELTASYASSLESAIS